MIISLDLYISPSDCRITLQGLERHRKMPRVGTRAREGEFVKEKAQVGLLLVSYDRELTEHTLAGNPTRSQTSGSGARKGESLKREQHRPRDIKHKNGSFPARNTTGLWSFFTCFSL